MEFYLSLRWSDVNLKTFQFPTGWNSTRIARRIWNPPGVSIPNGMEFYKNPLLKLRNFQIVSIPNGMEFYWFARSRFCRLLIVSIPNGMEFYFGALDVKTKREMFQFPTGWNSTVCGRLMHEYVKKFQFPTGWNSTRPQCGCMRIGIEVSIPNGMEFYASRTSLSLGEDRFNSQRDGILLFGLATEVPYLPVSIPNGMEFYGTNTVDVQGRRERFNSQRDGILLNSP